MIHLPRPIAEAILAHARGCHPEECCGLLAADPDGAFRMAYPLTNQLASRTNYTIDPVEHFRAMKHAERQGWEVVGVFHSHPHSVGYPSPTDIRLAPDPQWLYLIVGMEDLENPTLRGFRIRDGGVRELGIEVIESTRERN